MRTRQDLEAAFAELADTAASTEQPLQSERRAPANRIVATRRVMAPLAAALVTAAVATTMFVATRSDHPSSPQEAATAPSTALRPPTSPSANGTPDLVFAFDASPGNTIASVAYTIDRGGQTMRFDQPTSTAAGRLPDPPTVGAPQIGQVTLFYVDPPTDSDEAGFDVSRYQVLQRVNVRTSKGFFAYLPANSADKTERLLWQYAPGAWAEAIAPTRTAMLAMAKSVRPATTQIFVPVDPTYDKSGEYLNTLSTSGMSGTFEVTSPSARHGYYVTWGRDAKFPDAAGTPQAPRTVRVNGRLWTYRTVNGALRAELERRDSNSASYTQPLTVTTYYKRPLSELVGYLKTLRIADRVSDSSDWFAASKALS